MPDEEWTDEQLLDYFEIHSQTERALFSHAHVDRFLKLVGRQMPKELEGSKFIVCRYREIHEFLDHARRRLRVRLVWSASSNA